MRKSTMVTLTSGDRHRFEPPRTQTAFIDLTNLFAKSLLNRLGSKTTKLWVFRPILLGPAKNAASVAFVPSTRWYQAVAVELKRRYILGLPRY